MKISEQTNTRLIVESSDLAFARMLLFFSIVCVCAAAVMLFVLPNAWRAESFHAALAGAALFLLAYLAVFEQATFIFDCATRTVAWRRRRAFSVASGVVGFRQIREVVLQTSIGNAVNPNKRIALLLTDGELALSMGYAPDAGGSARALAETIRKHIGLPPV